MLYTSLLVFISLLVSELKSQPFVWPLPQTYTINDLPNLYVSNTFEFKTTSGSSIVENALQRYERIMFPHTPEGQIPNNVPILLSLEVNVGNDNEVMYLGMDESYQITFPDLTSAVLTANAVWGALRGLETFSQLIYYNFTAGYYVGYEASITDFPRFMHRGVLIDTSRHFEPLDGLRSLISSMSYAKFNVLHWHIVDTQSFPYESQVFPDLWEGAYTVYERYSLNDVKEVVNFALQHGIRVIPEFDVPGHAQSWCVGYPGVCPSPSCTSPLNPAADETWDVITGLIGEAYSGVFIDNYIHLGGDEVNTNCWTSTPSVNDWLVANNYTTRQAYGYFVERAMDIAHFDYGLQVINWVEVFNNFNTSLNKSITTIEVWKPKKDLAAAVSLGFRALLADNDLWYLDHLTINWKQMYMNEPLENIDDPTQQALVQGGEVCMWGETVDISDMQQTIWPRAGAVAERLWSARDVNDTTAALPRMEYFRCLLNQRGIQAAPVNNAQARNAPPGPGSCYVQ